MLLLVGSTELAGRNVLHLADRGHESRRRGGSGSRAGRLRRHGARTTAVTAEAITIAGYRANRKLSLAASGVFRRSTAIPAK